MSRDRFCLKNPAHFRTCSFSKREIIRTQNKESIDPIVKVLLYGMALKNVDISRVFKHKGFPAAGGLLQTM